MLVQGCLDAIVRVVGACEGVGVVFRCNPFVVIVRSHCIFPDILTGLQYDGLGVIVGGRVYVL